MDLIDCIHGSDVVLLDGAMGTELDKRELMSRGENNICAPEAVRDIHRQYAACGCHVLITNTLTMNRIYIETHNVDVNVHEVNRAGATLARQAAGAGQFVLGDISSTGQMLKPYGTYEESEFYEAFREQAGVLADAGVDGFIIETMFDLREALCAVRACKEHYELPVLVSLAFTTAEHGGRTIMGNSAQRCARELAGAGADAVGANCGDVSPSEMATIISVMRSDTSLPLLAQPNAGTPKLIQGKTVFDLPPEPFAAGIQECLQAGARLVGGCCGTTPDHIRVVARLMRA